MMKPDPRDEHRWLERLVGEWAFEAECSMGAGQAPTTTTGTDSVRSLGGAWIVSEGSAGTPDGGTATNIMTLGFDPGRGRFTGTFICSVMTHLWLYEGALDASGRVLTLDAEGPSFAGDGSMAKYQDILELTGTGERRLTSQVLGPDGGWTRFMSATYRRIG
jgi:hypothetical protein